MSLWLAVQRWLGGPRESELSPENQTGAPPASIDVQSPPAGRGKVLARRSSTTVQMFSPDGATLASRGENPTVVQLWDVGAGRRRAELRCGNPRTVPVAFSPDSTIVATGESRVLRLWDVATGRQRVALNGHGEHAVSRLAFNPSGSTLASGGDDGTVVLWDVAAGKPRARIVYPVNNDRIYAVEFSPDGAMIATGSNDWGGSRVRLWDSTTGKHLAQLTGREFSSVNAIAFSPDGNTLAVGSDKELRIWDVTSRKQLAELNRYTAISKLIFSPDGATLVSLNSSFYQEPTLWDAATWQVRAKLVIQGEKVQAMACSPDGGTVATGTPNGVWLWDVSSGKLRSKLGPYNVRGLAFGLEGKTLAVGDSEGTIYLCHSHLRK